MATSPPTRLAVEIEFYERHKSEWLKKYRNQYVVAKGEELLGFFVEFRDAYFAGVEKYGSNTDFLVKPIVEQEPVTFVF
jgi:hypothetical protein